MFDDRRSEFCPIPDHGRSHNFNGKRKSVFANDLPTYLDNRTNDLLFDPLSTHNKFLPPSARARARAHTKAINFGPASPLYPL